MSNKQFLYHMIDSVIQNDNDGATAAFKSYITPKTQEVMGLVLPTGDVSAEPDAPADPAPAADATPPVEPAPPAAEPAA